MKLERARRLESILHHLHRRARAGQPLAGGDGDDAFMQTSPLARDRMYKHIRRGLERGEPLSKVLADYDEFPRYGVDLVRAGEEGGDLAAALGTLLERMPWSNRFRFQRRAIGLYLGITLTVFALFLVYYSMGVGPRFHGILAGVPSDAKPALFSLVFAPGLSWSWVVLGVFAVLIAARVVFRKNLALLALKPFPVFHRVYAKVVSLELASACAYYLNYESSAFDALERAAEQVEDADLRDGIRRAVHNVREGAPFDHAFYSIPGLERFPVFGVVGLGEATGRTKEMLNDFIGTMEANLENTLDAEMRVLFKLCVLVCGIIVGAGLVAAFQGIIYSYNFVM